MIHRLWQHILILACHAPFASNQHTHTNFPWCTMASFGAQDLKMCPTCKGSRPMLWRTQSALLWLHLSTKTWRNSVNEVTSDAFVSSRKWTRWKSCVWPSNQTPNSTHPLPFFFFTLESTLDYVIGSSRLKLLLMTLQWHLLHQHHGLRLNIDLWRTPTTPLCKSWTTPLKLPISHWYKRQMCGNYEQRLRGLFSRRM